MSRWICELYQKCSRGDEDGVRTFLASHSLSLPPSHPPSLPPSATPTPTVCKRGDDSSGMEVGDGGDVGEGVMEEEGEWEVVRKARRKSKH